MSTDPVHVKAVLTAALRAVRAGARPWAEGGAAEVAATEATETSVAAVDQDGGRPGPTVAHNELRGGLNALGEWVGYGFTLVVGRRADAPAASASVNDWAAVDWSKLPGLPPHDPIPGLCHHGLGNSPDHQVPCGSCVRQAAEKL